MKKLFSTKHLQLCSYGVQIRLFTIFVLFLGSNKLNASLPASSLLSEVIKEAEKVTGVPSSSQKLIINGKALTSLDHNKLITECRIQDGTKIMVLGKRYDPESDSMYQKVVAVEQLVTEAQKKLSEVSNPTCIDEKCSYSIKSDVYNHRRWFKALRGIFSRLQKNSRI